jgi:hypothetical protein
MQNKAGTKNPAQIGDGIKNREQRYKNKNKKM